MNITKSSKIFLGDTEIYRVEYQGTVIWKKQVVPPTPTIAYDYQVANSSTEFATEDKIPYAYSYNDTKWYCLNNNNQYELYGIYEKNDNIDLITKYEGKLCISQGKEYQCTNNTWVYVGDVTGGGTPFTPTEGMPFPRKFQIKVSDYQSVGRFDFNVDTRQGLIRVSLLAYSIDYVSGEYRYGWETHGTISTDNEWIYFDAGDGNEYTVDWLMEQPRCQLYSGGVTYPLEYDENRFNDFVIYHGFYYASENDVRYKGKDITYNINKVVYEWDGSKFVTSQKQFNDIYMTFKFDRITWSNISKWGIFRIYDTDFNIITESSYYSSSYTYYAILNKKEPGYSNMSSPISFIECVLPISVTSLAFTFNDCTGLTKVTIPDTVTKLGENVFSSCSALTEVNIPNSVTLIDFNAIASCGVIEINIPDSVTTVYSNAFAYNTNLKTLSIGSGVKTWAINTLYCSQNVETITVSESNPVLDSRENCNAVINTNTNTLICGCKNSTIPNSVTSIGDYAFTSCRGLTKVDIPNSVTSIGNYAFSSCRGLTKVDIPDSVTSIGDDAFRECSSLTSVTVSSGVTAFSRHIFDGCTSLSLITCNAETPIGTIYDYAFRNLPQNGILSTPNSNEDWTSVLSMLPSGWTVVNY